MKTTSRLKKVLSLPLSVIAIALCFVTIAYGFNPNANGVVRVVLVQPDGKILLGGDFTALSPNDGSPVTRNHIARLNSDGTLDTNFDPNANDTVRTIALQSDGKILAGGDFTAIGGQSRTRLARLGATIGAADSLNLSFSGNVRAIAVQTDGKILVGGEFTKIGDETRNFIARVDSNGSLDSFDPKANGVVRAIALQSDGKILVGGQFNGEVSIGGENRNYIARLSSSTGLADSFDPDATGQVLSIFVQSDGKILVGGSFHGTNSIGGEPRNYIARLDPDSAVADSFNPNANGDVTSITVQTDGKVVIGGFFFGPKAVGEENHSYLARLNAAGTVDSSFAPNVRGAVHSLAALANGKILVGGVFKKRDAESRNRLCRIDATTGAID